ncbi:NAD(P)/FAD-dependent oxidoreductase [Polaribacter dokdonensis]|uniref:D-amino acid dehydrogenase n=1 Tax=Polaribacter dokdonensis DSW-5 TaxID=1300348 RepID=A0A0N0CEX9_9FLAO|nr:FAD-dependent oxidoreductase [Polaribacter dokdonensis]KOY50988.1 D-amino acid dehydrogenase [Polaribacter dokdonensis DSW-5]SEE21278.1 D-amino-acid dehydrogenase [Polaribacter dokdonensis DSW-5]
MSKSVIIVGGGIVGLCSAYYLQKEGHKVTVIDKSDFSSGASYVNAGYITPSHIISLAAPGMINKGVKWMFNSSSPFYVKPRLNYDFLKWSLNFKKSATVQKVQKSIPIIKDINILSRELYQDLKNSNEFDFFYQHKGLLMCYQTDEAGEEEWDTGKIAIKEGLKVEHLSREQVHKIEPNAGLNIKGAVYYQSDAHMTPNNFMQQLKTYLQKKGVSILGNEEVTDIVTANNKVTSIKTTNLDIKSDEFVFATGAWSQNFAKKLGIKIPIQAGKGYSINVKKETNITLPAILIEAKVAVTPMDGFTRFAGTMEIGGINHKINKKRVDAIATAAEKYYSNLKIDSKEKEATKCGLRPLSPDGLPFIGKSSKCKNVTFATGHAMMGWSLGPATGKLVSEIIGDKEYSLNIYPFAVDRFS